MQTLRLTESENDIRDERNNGLTQRIILVSLVSAYRSQQNAGIHEGNRFFRNVMNHHVQEESTCLVLK